MQFFIHSFIYFYSLSGLIKLLQVLNTIYKIYNGATVRGGATFPSSSLYRHGLHASLP
jgi:hypothetical protein